MTTTRYPHLIKPDINSPISGLKTVKMIFMTKNYVKIASVLFIIGIFIFCTYMITKPSTNYYEPIIYPHTYEDSKGLEFFSVNFINEVIITPTPNAITTLSPIITLKPENITPTPTITPTKKPTPTERHTELKNNDFGKGKPTQDGVKTGNVIFSPEKTYLGYSYYYSGDYAVFTTELRNIGNFDIINPLVRVFVNGILISSKNIELTLPVNTNVEYYFDYVIPNYPGFYKIEFKMYDNNENELIALYKEMNIFV
jgi:uncharacterized membrane protein